MILTWRKPGDIRTGDQAISFIVWPSGDGGGPTPPPTPAVDVFYNHFIRINEGAKQDE